MSHSQAYTVSAITKTIKRQLQTPELENIAVEGEISTFTRHTSGHMYLTLKDDQARLRAVMFRNRNQQLQFQPERGMTVLAVGSIGIYEPNGEYQLYIDRMVPHGLGALQAAFEQLKQQLQSEGLFDAARKHPLPRFPRGIAVITSRSGAALRDIVSVTLRRWPTMPIWVLPALVQGEQAPTSIQKAFRLLERVVTERPKTVFPDAQTHIDLVILARGGGSVEELWSFNSEEVARAIAACSIPVVSAVGHETDVTIADFVADHRAPTPSAAAELAVPDRDKLQTALTDLTRRLRQVLPLQLAHKRQYLERLANTAALARPKDRLASERQRTDELLYRMEMQIQRTMQEKQRHFKAGADQLHQLSPLSTLQRGYAYCSTPDGTMVSDYRQVKQGDLLAIRLRRGQLECQVRKGSEYEQGNAGGGNTNL